jgi:2-keto-3-deoxy-L-rhamnonate aldolase RhmA
MNEKEESGIRWANPSFVPDTASSSIAESLLRGAALRKKAAAGWAFGTFLIELPTASTLTAIALAGFDFVVLDMEHSAVGFSALESLIVASNAAGLTTLVRTWGQDVGLIGKVLDMGAHGIMAAHVDSAQRAQDIVAQARFAPHGRRGFSPLTKYDALEQPLRQLSASTYVVLQIEGQEGLAHVDAISAVPGVDAVFVGPYDLSLSLGVPPGSPEVFAAAERMARGIPASVQLGIYIDDPTRCGDWAARRFSLQCVSFDGRMLSNGARAVAEAAKRSLITNK